MGCNTYQELISRMLDEDLSPAEQDALEEHLSVCAECRALYESFLAVSGALDEQLEEPPERLHENIMAEIRREEIRKKNRLSRPAKVVLTAAACLALIVGISAASGVLRPKGGSQSSVMLADSNHAASTRSAPAAAAAEEESTEDSAEAEIALYDAAVTEAAPEAPAPAAVVPETAAASAAGQEAGGASLSDRGAEAWDLSDRLSLEELRDFLGCTYIDTKLDFSAQPLLVLIVDSDDGPVSLSFYEEDGEVFYVLPERGAYLADRSPAELETFLEEWEGSR